MIKLSPENLKKKQFFKFDIEIYNLYRHILFSSEKNNPLYFFN